MKDTIGCYDRDCICNRPEPKECEKCDDGWIYGDWECDACGSSPCGELLKESDTVATGPCKGCRDHATFLRERTACKCQTTFRGE